MVSSVNSRAKKEMVLLPPWQHLVPTSVHSGLQPVFFLYLAVLLAGQKAAVWTTPCCRKPLEGQDRNRTAQGTNRAKHLWPEFSRAAKFLSTFPSRLVTRMRILRTWKTSGAADGCYWVLRQNTLRRRFNSA